MKTITLARYVQNDCEWCERLQYDVYVIDVTCSAVLNRSRSFACKIKCVNYLFITFLLEIDIIVNQDYCLFLLRYVQIDIYIN